MRDGDIQPHLRHFLFLCTCWLFPYDGMGKPVMSGQLSVGKLGGFFSLLFCFLFLLLRFPLQAADVMRELLLHIRFLLLGRVS